MTAKSFSILSFKSGERQRGDSFFPRSLPRAPKPADLTSADGPFGEKAMRRRWNILTDLF